MENKQFKGKGNKSNIGSTRSPSPKLIPDIENENSPLHIACTQESNDNIDVVWDWNSPQNKKQPRKYLKKLLIQSPKVPLKKHPSINSIQDLEKLREELQSLKNELAVPDHEDSLQLSPLEEAEYKTFTDTSMDTAAQEYHEQEFDELMDNNLNEQLFACSQQIEENLQSSTKNGYNENKSPKSKSNFIFKKTSPKERALANDSFDDLIKRVDLNRLTNTLVKDTFSIKTYTYSNKQAIQTNSGKVEFYRTQSFEIANNMSPEIVSKICTQEEIERKRQEALARLECKRKFDKTLGSSHLVPTLCSNQEIEEKRLRALAKVEAKKHQEIIERKRQEALKRLEMKRQKKAPTVKSSLVARLT